MNTSEKELYTVVAFLMSSEVWQQQRDILGWSAAEKHATEQRRRFHVYKVKIYDSLGSLVKELI